MKTEMGRPCSTYGESGRACRVLVRKPEGRRPSGRPRCRWEHNIKMNLTEVGWKVTDQINLAVDRDRWRALRECDNEPLGFIKCGKFRDQLRTCQLFRNNFVPWSQLVSQSVSWFFGYHNMVTYSAVLSISRDIILYLNCIHNESPNKYTRRMSCILNILQAVTEKGYCCHTNTVFYQCKGMTCGPCHLIQHIATVLTEQGDWSGL